MQALDNFHHNMGQLEIPVNPLADPPITETNSFESECFEVHTLLVNVPGMETRHVSILYSGDAEAPEFTESITADTTYNVYLDGQISSTSSNNIRRSRVRVTVRDTNSTGDILDVQTYTRDHTTAIC